MKKYIIIIATILLGLSAQAQFKVEYTVGYGDYKMGEMKDLLLDIQSDLKFQYPVDIAITDNFPSYVTHNLGVGYKLSKHEFGTNLTYLTTAGRMAYSDYSGEIVNKLTLNAYRVGAFYRYHFYQIGITNVTKISLFGELSPAITFTDIKTKGHIKVGNEINGLDERYRIRANTTGISILPQIGACLNLPSGLGVHIIAGYDIEMGAKFKQNKNIEVDWSGLRLGIGLSYRLTL